MTTPTEADMERAREIVGALGPEFDHADFIADRIAVALAETRKAGEAAGRKAALEEVVNARTAWWRIR